MFGMIALHDCSDSFPKIIAFFYCFFSSFMYWTVVVATQADNEGDRSKGVYSSLFELAAKLFLATPLFRFFNSINYCCNLDLFSEMLDTEGYFLLPEQNY